MVKHNQNIIINSNLEKSWDFMTDLSRSLIFDNYFQLIELPGKYSINKKYEFNVSAKYLFIHHRLKSKIVDVVAPNLINIQFENSSIRINKIFEFSIYENQVKLYYFYQGSFSSPLNNILLSPMIKLSSIYELRYIKKAIESSEYISEKKINPIGTYK